MWELSFLGILQTIPHLELPEDSGRREAFELWTKFLALPKGHGSHSRILVSLGLVVDGVFFGIIKSCRVSIIHRSLQASLSQSEQTGSARFLMPRKRYGCF